MKKFYWQKLLLAWEKEERGYGIGLSIPYLVGARHVLNSSYNPTQKDAVELLNEIMDYGVEGRQVIIRNCSDHESTMIGLTSEKLAYSDKVIPNSKDVIAEDVIFERYGETREDIITRLIEEYSDKIQAEEFSVQYNQWGYYDDDEQRFIKNTLDED